MGASRASGGMGVPRMPGISAASDPPYINHRTISGWRRTSCHLIEDRNRVPNTVILPIGSI